MYWPIGTPRIYAGSTSQLTCSSLVTSHDGIASPSPHDASQLQPPPTPKTPLTPAVNSVEHHETLLDDGHAGSQTSLATRLPLNDVVVVLRVARAGHLFAYITSCSIFLWQTKPPAILAVVVRSQSSLQLYGRNIDLLLRPDSAILVIRTHLGFLITYSIATDGLSTVYKAHFPNHHNVQRRKQRLPGARSGMQPDEFLWGPGEGAGVKDVSVRFRMVIKVDAGIECALALDEELVVATRKPAAVQCIRWTAEGTGSQTKTEILSRMAWMDSKSPVIAMCYDRPMNLATWITNDGRAYAVQRHQGSSGDGDDAHDRRLFHGHCFHLPSSSEARALHTAINARLSLIAVGCSDGAIVVYSVRDYSGGITFSHIQRMPASASVTGALTTMAYSPDGYCLFCGFQKGWAMWSVFGKLGSHSFGAEDAMSRENGEEWLTGVVAASWIGGGSEILLVGSSHDAIWSLEMARSAITGCYTEANVFRTVLQTPTTIMVYRGYDLPNLTSISAEPFLWHTATVPPTYMLNQWPLRQSVISPDGRYLAVAGRRGLAHYSVNSGRWKTFASPEMENEFQIRGGMCWYQHILIAAIESKKTHELRLLSREAPLDTSQLLYSQQLPAPVVLVMTSGEDSLLVYTYENLLYHFIIAASSDSVRLVQVGQIAFHGIVRSPARVRGLSWIVPEGQLADGDASQDVAVASVIFLVDGKLVLLSPSLNHEGQLKYDMRVIAHNVEYHVAMREQPPLNAARAHQQGGLQQGPPALRDSLWLFNGVQIMGWTNVGKVLQAVSSDNAAELAAPVCVAVDFYPLSILLEKGVVLGVESDLVQRRDLTFSFFHFTIRTHLVLPDLLRYYLRQNNMVEAATLSEHYQGLEYMSHALEVLLHRVLDEEVDTSPKPQDAVLPRVLSLLSSSRDYLDVVLRCTRKTEVRQWKTLFAYLPPVQELFEESLQRASLKTAGGYLIILHTLEELDTSMEQSVRVLSRAIEEKDWNLCKELARFLAAMDGTGEILQRAMAMLSLTIDANGEGIASRLELPASRAVALGNSGQRDGSRQHEKTLAEH
ncbi:hypothetical protein CDD81_2605 [Ophiocordyceps australis]|uniref:RIC1 C-terminal alpha solenoid region domain-containing protein n=1 Tax=Ophiocordyceps australis TaxID=1399860 RepID=A0A2C5XTI9_9HYPO|nr:hypothetical protein CDD81_2605 [Ophiocordyceps australis]